MWRLERPCRPCRQWIQGSAWWDWVWQAGTRCCGWENPRVCPSIRPLSWEHMLLESDSHLITYKSRNAATQTDFILFRRTMRKLVTDVKVIPGEEVPLQHQLLVCDMRIDVPPKSKRMCTPRLKVWKLKDPQTSNHFQVFTLHVSASAGVADAATKDIWNNIKTGLLKTPEEVCGTTQPHRWRRETWWWNGHMEKTIAAKLSRPGRQIKALEHHMMQPNALPDMQCTMLVKKPTPSCQKSTALLTSLEERTLMLFVTNWWRIMQRWQMSMSEDAKTEGLVRALPKTSQRWVWLGHRPPVWRTTSGRPADLIHH